MIQTWYGVYEEHDDEVKVLCIVVKTIERADAMIEKYKRDNLFQAKKSQLKSAWWEKHDRGYDPKVENSDTRRKMIEDYYEKMELECLKYVSGLTDEQINSVVLEEDTEEENYTYYHETVEVEV